MMKPHRAVQFTLAYDKTRRMNAPPIAPEQLGVLGALHVIEGHLADLFEVSKTRLEIKLPDDLRLTLAGVFDLAQGILREEAKDTLREEGPHDDATWDALIFRRAHQIFVEKNTAYGDSFSVHGVVGVVIRITDKIRRLKTLISTPATHVGDESIIDTWGDLYNYCLMARMLLDEEE